THYAQDIFTSRALSFLTATNLPQPFCLVLAYTLPHRQLVEPPGPNPYRHKPWPPQERTYAAMVSKLDADIGRIAAALDANPSLASNTLLIITSDNGPHDADDHSPFFFNSFGNLRGGKFLLFEGGIRVPCIMRWCGVIPTNTVCSVPCGFVDIHATLAQLAGAPPPPSHGVSLLPLLSGNSLLSRPIPLLWFTPPRSPRDPIAALRSNQWKFILRADGLPKLYNLLHDPSETQNLAPLYPDLVRSFYFTLRQQLRQQIPPLTSPSTSPPK
ncbi:MAG: sulfatase-like hydrolase/transferase, partial [bacterium]|nr:sulfatase-like hydrolase/transferase [bacterium]